MHRLRVLSGREVRKILQQNCFEFVRQRGSHMMMRRKLATGSRSLPVPDHREVSIKTLSDIIEQSGLPRALFEEQQ